MAEVKVGDVIYRAYYFGDEVILDISKVVSMAYVMLDLDELNATCKIEREDKSIHEVKVKRIIDEWSTSETQAFIKLFNKHINVVKKVLDKMEGIDNDR